MHVRLVEFRVVASNGDPDEHDDNVKTLALATVVLVRPHAVLLLVPVGTGGRMHATAADVGLAVGGGSCLGRRRDVRLLGAGLAALRLVEGGRGDQVLHDGAVAGELEARGRRALGSRLGDDRLKDRRLQDIVRPCDCLKSRAQRTMIVEFHSAVFA